MHWTMGTGLHLPVADCSDWQFGFEWEPTVGCHAPLEMCPEATIRNVPMIAVFNGSQRWGSIRLPVFPSRSAQVSRVARILWLDHDRQSTFTPDYHA